MSCQDAAAVAVREIVVAGDESDPVGAAQAVAGADSSVSVTYGSEAVSVTVSCPVIPDPLGVLPTVVTAEAPASRSDGVAAADSVDDGKGVDGGRIEIYGR